MLTSYAERDRGKSKSDTDGISRYRDPFLGEEFYRNESHYQHHDNSGNSKSYLSCKEPGGILELAVSIRTGYGIKNDKAEYDHDEYHEDHRNIGCPYRFLDLLSADAFALDGRFDELIDIRNDRLLLFR